MVLTTNKGITGAAFGGSAAPGLLALRIALFGRKPPCLGKNRAG